jgi:hypothetical protein
MLPELLIVLGALAFCLVTNNGLLTVIYGKKRPTKIFGKIMPSFVVVAVCFFILGKLGATRFGPLVILSSIACMALLLNFIIVGSRLVKPLNALTYGLSAGGDHMAAASRDVSSASQSLAENAAQQASGLRRSASSLEEMASMAQKAAAHTQEGKNISEEAGRALEDVSTHMDQMTGAIEDISRSSEETAKIVKTIDDIAFQTNLLALNAAIEAARSGEAGAGFAVVADEVKKLAGMAAEAAKNSSRLIEKTMNSVKNGNRLKEATEQSFKHNLEISGQIGTLIDEIAEASKEQSEGISLVNRTVAEMDEVVQQSASNAAALAAAAGGTSSQAENMKTFVAEMVALFGVGERGTPAEAKKILKKLITYAKSEGRKRILEEISNRQGKFVDRDIYAFAFDMDAVIVAHGGDHSLIGKDLLNVRTQDGKYFQREIMQIAKKQGGGHVDYSWMNPVTKVEAMRGWSCGLQLDESRNKG